MANGVLVSPTKPLSITTYYNTTDWTIWYKHCYRIGNAVFVSLNGKGNSTAGDTILYSGLPAPVGEWHFSFSCNRVSDSAAKVCRGVIRSDGKLDVEDAGVNSVIGYYFNVSVCYIAK